MGWLTTFSHCFTALLPSHERGDYLESVQLRIRPLLCDESGKWTADYTRLRFRAVLEGPAAPQPSSPAVRTSGQHEPALDRNEPGGDGAKEGR